MRHFSCRSLRMWYCVGSGKTFEYDASGSISKWHDFMEGGEYASSTLANNDDSRLTSFSSTTLNFGEYVYDHLGQRVIKNELGTTVFIYDIFGNLISEYGPDGGLLNDYLYLGGRRMAKIKGTGTGGGGGGGGGSIPWCDFQPPQPGGFCGISGLTEAMAMNWALLVAGPFLVWVGFRYRRNKVALGCIIGAGLGIIIFIAATEAQPQDPGAESLYFYHNDHLGTPQIMTDSAGKVVWDAVYQPFGEINSLTASVENNFRFPGQYEDGITGMYYNHHRYYMPELGRYNMVDPIISRHNYYVYVDSNPIKKMDPWGLIGCTWSFIDSLLTKYDRAYQDWRSIMNLPWGPRNAYLIHDADPYAGDENHPVWCFQYAQCLINYLNSHVDSRGCCSAGRQDLSETHTIVKISCRSCGVDSVRRRYDPWFNTLLYYYYYDMNDRACSYYGSFPPQ